MPRMLPLIALVLALTGCAGPAERMLPPDPPPKAAFASEEEALAAAVDVFDRLTVISDEIATSGGEGVERLEEVSTGEFLMNTSETFSEYPKRGVHQEGVTTFRDPVLQQYSSGPLAAVLIYVCVDFTNVDIVGADGVSVVAKDRPDTLYLLVTYDFGDDGTLLVSRWERWDERTC